MTLTDEISAGQNADLLLNNPAYKKAIKDVRAGIVSAMESSALGDQATHNRLVIALQLLSQIEGSIKTVAETGKLAKIQVEESKVKKIRSIFGV